MKRKPILLFCFSIQLDLHILRNPSSEGREGFLMLSHLKDQHFKADATFLQKKEKKIVIGHLIAF